MPEAFEVVVFDLDGTLTDSQVGILASYRFALGEFGLEADDEMIRRWIGPPLREGLVALRVPVDRLESAVATYRKYYSATGLYENRVYDGVEAMLATLTEAGLNLAVATSKPADLARRILDHFGISTFFSVVAGAALVGHPMRKADILADALGRLRRPDPASVVMVGDRDEDVLAAIANGICPVGVTWGYGSAAELTGAGAATLVTSPAAVAELVVASEHPWRS